MVSIFFLDTAVIYLILKFCQQDSTTPDKLTTWVSQVLGRTWWKERTNFRKLSSDLHSWAVSREGTCTCAHIHTHESINQSIICPLVHSFVAYLKYCSGTLMLSQTPRTCALLYILDGSCITWKFSGLLKQLFTPSGLFLFAPLVLLAFYLTLGQWFFVVVAACL